MSQAHRPKQPLDVLQSMINGILIEVGRALRKSDKEGGRTLANSSTRLQSFLPRAIENFHEALDDLECDIVRAKSVLIRDLEDLRARRIALENPPPPVPEETAELDFAEELDLQGNSSVENNQPSPPPTIKEEHPLPQIPATTPTEDIKPINLATDPPQETISKVAESSTRFQGLSPPSSLHDSSKSNPVGLGINTTATVNSPVTAGLKDLSIDSLFEMPDNNNSGSDGLFDGMDFLQDSNTDTHDPSQGQPMAFDLSTFGNTAPDFNMPDLQASNDTGNNTTNTVNKQDDLFGIGDETGSGDMMDLDLSFGPADGNPSVFDDMYFGGGDDRGMGGDGEMEHGDFDNAYFGLDD